MTGPSQPNGTLENGLEIMCVYTVRITTVANWNDVILNLHYVIVIAQHQHKGVLHQALCQVTCIRTRIHKRQFRARLQPFDQLHTSKTLLSLWQQEQR